MADSTNDSPDPKNSSQSKENRGKSLDKLKILLYAAMALSAWGDRMWNFAVGIYFISLNPTNLQGVALNGIVLNLVVILFGPNIGDWIDRNPRLTTLRKSLYTQNLTVTLMALLVLVALLYQSSLPSYWMFIIQGFLIGIGAVATLASVSTKVCISRDWVVALYGSDRQNLAKTNATMRRIDLISNILAPVLTGFIMAFWSRWMSAIFIAGWNVISLFVELILYTKVYRLAGETLSKKISKTNVDAPKKSGFSKLLLSVRSLGTYRSLSTCLPGFSLALLYMTVLSFDSVTRAYVIEQGLSEAILGLLNGLGAVLGIVGTLVYPVFVKRIGLVRTGVIGFWSEFSALVFCLFSLITPGSLFTVIQDFFIGSCSSNSFSTNTNNTINGNIIDWIVYPCSYGKISVLLLVFGITVNRFGLWLADLTVNQLQQERVPEDIRGLIGGTQQSLNQFFDMLRYILIIILPRMEQFGFHICLSVLSVFTSSLIYTLWSCSAASQRVPPAADVEMAETQTDLADHYETHLKEKLNFVDQDTPKTQS